MENFSCVILGNSTHMPKTTSGGWISYYGWWGLVTLPRSKSDLWAMDENGLKVEEAKGLCKDAKGTILLHGLPEAK